MTSTGTIMALPRDEEYREQEDLRCSIEIIGSVDGREADLKQLYAK